MEIRAGEPEEVSWSNGRWLILDVGFCGKPTCGFLFHEAKPIPLTFTNAVDQIINKAHQESVLNLCIEAPLSVAFDFDGNPKGRNFEKRGTQQRYWYTGPGAAVSLAALFLMQRLINAKPKSSIRLFEGFVSFKKKDRKSDHIADVLALKEAISKGTHIIPEPIQKREGDRIQSIFHVLGHDFGIPPIIEA